MPYAVYREAEMLMKGQGVAQNTEKATRLFETALQLFQQAERKQPDDKLQYRIGKMYRDGVGTEKDMVQAENYFVLSAALGNSFAQYTLADIYLKQNDTEKTKEALQLLTVSAEKGKNVFSQYKLGAIYLAEEIVGKDTEKALQYFVQSAEQGNPFAQYKLGSFLRVSCWKPIWNGHWIIYKKRLSRETNLHPISSVLFLWPPIWLGIFQSSRCRRQLIYSV